MSKPFGGQIQSLARQPSQQEMQQMLSQQLQVLAREIYVRAVSDLMPSNNRSRDAEDFQDVAKRSQTAAKAYFESMGVQFEPEPTPDDVADVGPEPKPPDGQ